MGARQPACTVTHWGHSGFSVRTTGRLLAFDLVKAAMPAPVPADRALIFVSHAHADHFDPRALAWGAARFGGFDLPADADCLRMTPGEEATWDGARVRAYPSTDEGVSFWVEADGLRVFHAGDLNFWHWRAQSTPAEVRAAEQAFEAALAQLAGLAPDIAFFPVDARLCGPAHARGRARVGADPARRARPSGTAAGRPRARDRRTIRRRRTMKFTFNHTNLNVADLDRSLAFYLEALGLSLDRLHEAADGAFKLAFLSDGVSAYRLELTWLRDHPHAYELGENETHMCFATDDYEAAHEKHAQMGCICFENQAMGLYFIEDPDGHWIEIIRRRDQ